MSLLPSPANAAHDYRPYEFEGLGELTCAQYSAAYQGLKTSDTSLLLQQDGSYRSPRAMFESWVMGFVSAMNYAAWVRGAGNPQARTTDSDFEALQTYCEGHDKTLVIDAVIEVTKDKWSLQAAQPPAGSAPPVPQAVQPPSSSATALVIFQPTATEADANALLQAYQATVIEGPNAEGAYRLQFAAPLTPDQLKQYIEWMKGETKIVKDAAAG